MGGSSGIITADTKAEVRKLAKEWYQLGFTKWGMYPRIDVTDFPNKKDFLKEGCEEIHLIGNLEKAVICIKLMEEFKDSFYYKHLKPEAKDKKFGCIVSTHS